MTTLIIQLPARSRFLTDSAGTDSSASAAVGPKEFAYVLTEDGDSVARHGCCALPLMPRADTVVAVMAPADVSWHRLSLPKAPAAKLRAALASMLEEFLLTDAEDMHFALAPGGKAGQPTWVAACDHTWLTGLLMQVEKARIRLDRVVPGVWPDEPASGYFHEAGTDSAPSSAAGTPTVMLTWSTQDGVASWPLTGSLARGLLPEVLPPQARFFATPPVAAPAERWLGHVVTVQSHAEHLLQANRSLWNLLQFDLTPRSKGLNAVSSYWRQFQSPSWRAARVGVAVLAAVQLLGLNLWAWHEARQVKLKKADMVRLLQQTYPQVRAVIDAPVQMRRETEILRALGGLPGDSDLESLMGAMAVAWPKGEPTERLRYDGTSLSVAQPRAWGPADIEQFRSKVGATGAWVEASDGRLVVRRGQKG